MTGEDCFQHEVHHQGAERSLVKLRDVDSAHRASRGDQRLWNGFLLCCHEVACRATAEVLGMGDSGEIAAHPRTCAADRLAHDGDDMLLRAVEIKLQLTMLVDWSKRRDRGRPLALLAQALTPELHIPSGK